MDEKIEYIAEYVNEELARIRKTFQGHETKTILGLMTISADTIKNAIDAWEGGAGEK